MRRGDSDVFARGHAREQTEFVNEVRLVIVAAMVGDCSQISVDRNPLV
jgi:hypothetical protein